MALSSAMFLKIRIGDLHKICRQRIYRKPKYSKYKQYKFCNGKLPRLLDIPGFDGILIHIGNTEEDTDGCLLVGKNNVVGKVTESTVTFKALYDKMQAAVENGEEITITIK